MKKIILLSIFSICTTNTAEKTVVFHCTRGILPQLGNAERDVMQRIGIAESFSHATLTESQVRERVRKACCDYNNRDRVTVISPALEKQTADKLISIGVPVNNTKPAKL